MARYLTRSQASLYLGSLNCLGSTTDASGNVFTIEAQADGTDWGSAEPIEVAVQRWMTDGAVAATQGYENRKITFQVKISATNSVALAAGEAALVEAARSGLTLSWTPPEGSLIADTTVFDLWTCYLAHQFNSDEENRLTRTYEVTATAKPWARSTSLTSVAATPTTGAGTTVTVDACTSVTGWTGSPTNPALLAATAVRELRFTTITDFTNGSVLLTLTRTGSVSSLGTTPYLAIDLRFTGGSGSGNSVKVDGAACSLVGSVGSIGYWQVPVGVTSFTTLKISSTRNVNAPNQNVTMDVYDVSRTSVVGSTLTHKMLQRHLDVGGSVPTSGSVQIASPSATVLGNTLIYTCPDTGSGYSPPLRQFRVSGGTVTGDASMVSGSRETIGSNIIYDIPSGSLREGTYVVVARLNYTASGTTNVNFSTAFPGTTTLIDTITSTPGTGIAAIVWAIVGAIAIPGAVMPTDSQLAPRVIFTGSAATGTVPTLDELFILDVTHGAFSLVTSVSPFTFTRLWLDSPDADQSNNRPQIYFGANADRSDAVRIPYAQIKSLGDHDFDPDGSLVLTVTDNVDDAAVTMSYYQRWHTHAAA